MKIGVYGQVLREKQLTGIGYYLYHLLNALSQEDQRNTYQVFSDAPLSYSLPASQRFQTTVASQWMKRGFSFLGFPKAIAKTRCDLAFLPREVIPPRLSVPIIITVFDLFFLKLPYELRSEVAWDTKLHFMLAKKTIKRASKILAISEDTKKDVVELCGVDPGSVVVVPLGCAPSFFVKAPQREADRVFQRLGVTRPYFINTSSVWWGRKNLLRLIQAFSNFKKKFRIPYQLVITGKPGPSEAAMKSLIDQEGLSKDVLLLNYLLREDLAVLLQHAQAFIFPSLHEGFGLPVIEAMAAGCPVVTSRTSALVEIGGDAALFVDPYSIESIEEAMGKVVFDVHLKQTLISKGKERAASFTWEKTAKRTLDVFERSV